MHSDHMTVHDIMQCLAQVIQAVRFLEYMKPGNIDFTAVIRWIIEPGRQ